MSEKIRKLTGFFNQRSASKVIPKGSYCYDEFGKCPFWDSDPSKGDQEYGYCHYLKSGDWEENGTLLLWDQCKECGINLDD